MENNPLGFIAACAIFTVIGMTGGYMAAQQTSTGSEHDGEKTKEESPEDHDHAAHADEGSKISIQAAKNLGLKFIDLELTSFSTYRSIPASIEETPLTVRPLFAPIGGVVKEIKVKHGAVAGSGDVIITLLRDSIPQPSLTLTSELLDPERRLKGLTVKEIISIENKKPADKQLYLWKLALQRNGFWTTSTNSAYTILPESVQELPFSAAVLGELTANGLLTPELLKWFKSDKKTGSYFFEIASLLLQGKGLSYIQNLYDIGALNSTIEITAPATAKDWDVHGVFVKSGEHVDVGTKLAILHNPRKLHLVAHAKGSEIELLMKALETKATITAVGLTQGAVPTLTGLSVRNIQDDNDDKGGAVVHLEVSNNPSITNKDTSGTSFRSWRVRVGSKYLLRVPQNVLTDVFVLANNAVVSDGPDKIVYVQDGDSFEIRKVVVVYSDDEVAVLNSEDSELFADDRVVEQGAFGLDIALKAETGGAIDPHAGHNH